jgi:2-polyprenyl-3-methyl-5-hydroxy-6-metoxy-1,4-benzoquinol methylase
MTTTAEGVLQSLQDYPLLKSHCADLISAWPQHASALDKSMKVHSTAELALLDELAGMIDALPEDRGQLIASYRWMCERILEEELHFRRTGTYRCKTLSEAIEHVYSDKAFMKKYLEGILLSQIFWSNHAKSYTFFKSDFLPRLPAPYDYLEVGPGHGLFIAQAARDSRSRRVVGMDFSEESLSQTGEALRRFAAADKVELIRNDVAASTFEGRFDAITISEVLEHMEDPHVALRKLRNLLKPGGLMFINFPINSPAPDHIYLLTRPQEVCSMIEECGYGLVDFQGFPMTGYSLQRAMAISATVSCVAIVTPKS